MNEPTSPRGRPARWTDKTARQQHYRRQQAAKLRLLNDLLYAARNARWADTEMHLVTQEGDDLALMRALCEHYQRNHWCRMHPPAPDEGGTPPNI